MNESVLISGLRNQDAGSYATLFELYYSDLKSFASHYLCDVEAARDVVQTLLMDMYERADKLDVTTSLRAYLFTAVRNRCQNHLRSIKIKDSHHSNILEAHIFSNTVSAIEDHGILDELIALVDTMPTGCRDVFRLRIFRDYKFSEIASELDISENNAKVQMNHALVFLRKRLAPENFTIMMVLLYNLLE